MASGDPWTADERATLARLRSEGRNAREIAAALPGRSRFAVCGEAWRLGLPSPRQIGKPRSRKYVARKAKPRPPRVKVEPKFRPAPKPDKKPVVFTDDPASQLAAHYFAKADEAQRRRDGYREARSL